MKLVTFQDGAGADRLGALVADGSKIVDLQAAQETAQGRPDPAFASMLALIEAGDAALERARALAASAKAGRAVVARDAVRLRAPIPVPPQVRDCLCFEQHLVNAFTMARKLRAAAAPDPEAALRDIEAKGLFRIPEVWYQQPIYYKSNRFSVIGTDQDIEWPFYAEKLDFELEFGCFIKKGGKNIPKDKARDYIFGYSIFNDVSARDTQVIEMAGNLGPAKSKDFDTGNVIGPCIVTADEFDPYRQTMIARVNGVEWARGETGSMHWKFEDLIAYISRSETLHPGEFIGSGTVGGGCGLEQNRYLAPGDLIELEVTGIGVLRNRIVRS